MIFSDDEIAEIFVYLFGLINDDRARAQRKSTMSQREAMDYDKFANRAKQFF